MALSPAVLSSHSLHAFPSGSEAWRPKRAQASFLEALPVGECSAPLFVAKSAHTCRRKSIFRSKTCRIRQDGLVNGLIQFNSAAQNLFSSGVENFRRKPAAIRASDHCSKQESLKSFPRGHESRQGALTLLDVRLTLAAVDELIPVERRLPAPRDAPQNVGVYALVPASISRQEAPTENPFGLQRMSQDDAMGFALGAATGNRSGPINGPGWTLLDPAAALGASSFSSTEPLISNSPRRTLRVEFTCNKCWERTTRAINPQAYKTGTVFVQCRGCNVYHKLIDNLKLFHELKGPIYSPPGKLFHTPHDPFNPAPKGFGGLPFL